VDQKISVCKTALAYDPHSFFFSYKLGKFYAQHKNRMEEGIRLLEKAVEIKPESVEALKDLGVAYGLQKQFNKSIEVFEKALELSPNDPQLYINQGINYRQTGKENMAALYFRKARELQKNKDDKE
jgi:Flp pilus assembly protein TadD